MAEAGKTRHIGRGVCFRHWTDEDIGPGRCALDQCLKHRKVQLVGIDRTNEHQARTRAHRQIARSWQIAAASLTEMDSVGDVAKTMRARIESLQRLLQLWRRGEDGIHLGAELTLGPFKGGGWHPGLRLNAIHAVVDRGVETTKF